MTTALENPKAPHNQPFNINGSACRSKTNTWSNPKSDKYWRKKKIDAKMVK